MKNDDFWAGFALGAIVMFLISFCVLVWATNKMSNNWELKSIAAGVAEYRLNTNTWEKEFHFKTPKGNQ